MIIHKMFAFELMLAPADLQMKLLFLCPLFTGYYTRPWYSITLSFKYQHGLLCTLMESALLLLELVSFLMSTNYFPLQAN